MFDIGAGEFIALAIVALIVLGPEKLPRYAADAARLLRNVRRMATDARAEVTRELGPDMHGFSLDDLNPRSLVRKHLLEPVDLDDLSDLGDSNGAGRTKPAARRGPGERPVPREPGAPAPYDDDAT